MTKGKIVIETGSLPIEADFNVTGDSVVTIVITADDIKMHTEDEPTVTTG